MNIDKLSAWLCLKHAPELGIKGTLDLLSKYPDPCAYIGKPEHELYQSGLLKKKSAEHLAQAVLPHDFPRMLKLCERHGIEALFLSDADYPKALRSIAEAPLILYYTGNMDTLEHLPSMAVVGTRKASAYGKEMCAKLLKPACERGVMIISGLAMGIDTVAHHTALENGAPTIAVLASGLDSIYPPTNKPLAEKITLSGALISEYDPGSKLERWNFPDRNRIISALSQAVFIVEGGKESGAMLTARFAAEQGRPIFALPGNINIPNAAGPNNLIQQGAELISSAEDLLKLLKLESPQDDQIELFPTLEPDEQQLYDLFREAQQELSYDQLLIKTGLSFGKLSVLLLNLELKGVIAKNRGNSFILR